MTDSTISTFNRRAFISFGVALLALVSLCAGFAPIPFTAIVCYPASILLSATAFVTGLSSIRQIRVNGEQGKALAWISVWVGGLVILATLCLIALGIWAWPHILDFLKQAWQQLNLNSP